MKKRLKILILTEDFLPIYGGISSVVEKTAYNLQKSGLADVTIGTAQISDDYKGNYSDDQYKFKIIRCNAKYNKITTNMSVNLRGDKAFKKIIESEHYDVIHCHFPLKLYSYALNLGKRTKTPVIITCHSIFFPDIYNTVHNKLLAKIATKYVVNKINKAFKIWVVSGFCKNFLKKYGFREDSVVVNNAVEMERDITSLEIDIRKELNISPSTFLVTSIGRLVKGKNNILNIKALEQLKDKNLDIKYLIVGDGQETNNLKQLTKTLNVENYCIFIGAIKDRNKLGAIYKNSDLVLFPSYADSAGLIQVEAAYFSKPTLAIENSAISENMIDNKNGFVTKNNVEDYSQKLLYCYNNRDKVKEVGEEARKTIYRSYASDKVLSEIYNKYLDVINEYKHINVEK